jgi:hypothetical protein
VLPLRQSTTGTISILDCAISESFVESGAAEAASAVDTRQVAPINRAFIMALLLINERVFRSEGEYQERLGTPNHFCSFATDCAEKGYSTRRKRVDTWIVPAASRENEAKHASEATIYLSPVRGSICAQFDDLRQTEGCP